MLLEQCKASRCGKRPAVSSLGYVIGVKPGGVQVIREDNSIDWYYVLVNEQEIIDGDFVRVYKKKSGGVCRLYARYASYFSKDIAAALAVLDLGWQVQKCQLPEVDKDLFLLPPCLDVSKQIGFSE